MLSKPMLPQQIKTNQSKQTSPIISAPPLSATPTKSSKKLSQTPAKTPTPQPPPSQPTPLSNTNKPLSATSNQKPPSPTSNWTKATQPNTNSKNSRKNSTQFLKTHNLFLCIVLSECRFGLEKELLIGLYRPYKWCLSIVLKGLVWSVWGTFTIEFSSLVFGSGD